MAKLLQSDSRRMYSWWWDSHISPKNSKWLQENLTDMDSKVKTMIKLIEEDADSFARRAEMYYKKRPELMKHVEEFYRAYRALAERYDHATGVIRHAHRTMSEAFPNQVPQLFTDDSPASSVSGTEPRTPEISTPVRALCEEDSLQMDALNSSNSHAIKQNGEFEVDSDSVTRRNVEVRKGLNFDEVEEKEQSMQDSENHSVKEETPSRSDKVGESEGILTLKEALAKLEAEKEAGLAQYKQSLDKLSSLESDIAHAREVSREISDRANKAENEAVILKEKLSKSESEKEANLQKYHHCLDKISNLEKNLSSAQEDLEVLNERASRAETEAQSLKDELTKVAVEKDTALDNYMRSLEMISNLENKLQLTEEDARRLKERAEEAESEVEVLKQTVSKLTEEKEASALQYQQCLETILCVEKKLTSVQEEAQRLNEEIDYGVSKLKGAEEQCLLLERSNQSLHSELESLTLKMGTQTQELTEKDNELGRLWACIQEERLRFVEAETAFQTLQHLHTQTQEELRSLASELQRRAELLTTVESHNQSLQDEVLQVKEENKNLNEINESSALTINDMENEITGLKGRNGKLEEEVELRLDERNALQQEIYCLKEELNDLNKNHISFLDQVHAVGINPRSLELSVKELQDENSNLKETCSREQNEKVNLLKKLVVLEQLLEKNSILETSLSDLNAELGVVRRQMEALEQSCQSLSEEKSSLLDEKATLMTQLQVTSENLQKLLEKNSFLENSLSDAQDELQALKVEAKELRSLASELQRRAELLTTVESHNQSLQDEVLQVKEENKNLNEINESSALTINDMENEITGLKGRNGKLEEEVELRLDERNAIQQEIYCLKEELNDLNKNHISFLDQVHAVGINPRSLELSVKELQDENSNLKETCSREQNEKVNLLKKLVVLEQLLEKNSILETSLSDLNAELGVVRRQMEALEQSCQSLSEEKSSLLDEKATLMTQLQVTSENLQKLLEKNSFLENSLSDAQDELQALKVEAKELRSLASELQRRAELLTTVESHNQSLQDEVLQVKEENKNLNEINESSALTINDMENEITGLKGRNGKLEEEVELRLDERNAIQQEIYCLKEELNDLNKNHISFLDQVHAVGINPRSLELSVKELQDENSNLKETCSREQNEKVNLLKKLVVLEQLLEKNSILETSLSDLNAELGVVRRQMEALEQSCQSLSEEKSSLLDEKATLMTQLQVTSENLQKLLEKNSFLENSLSDAQDELQASKAESTSLENSYQLLEKEKAVLISERDDITSQLGTTQTRLDDMCKVYGDLEEKYMALEMENESTHGKLEGLQILLDVERQKHANFVQKNEQRFTAVRAEMELLQEKSQQRKRELEEMLDNALNYDIETFVLRKTVQDLEENSYSLLIKHQKLLEESSLSEKLILKLERNSVEQSVEIKSLFNQATSLREGTYDVLKALNIVQGHPCNDQNGQDHIYLNQLLSKVQDMKKSLHQAEMANQQQTVELSVLVTVIGQLKLGAKNLELEKNTVEHEFKIKTEQFLMLQSEVHELHETNEKLLSKLNDGDCKEEALLAQIEDLRRKLMNMQDACQVLHEENIDLRGERRFLTDELLLLEQKKDILQEENCVLFGEVLTLDNLSFISRDCIVEKLVLLRQLGSDLNKLHDVNGDLVGNLRLTEGRLEKLQMENAQVKEGLLKTQEELRIVSIVKDKLSNEVENGKKMLNQKELEHQEAEQKVYLVENKNLELTKIVEDLRMESNELKMIGEGQENQILKLSADNDHLSMENNRLCEASQVLELYLHKLRGKHDKSKTREENLHSELQKKITEIEMWEIEAALMFDQLHMSIVSQLLYEQKFHELSKTSVDSINENEGLKIQLAAYGPVVISLEESISSLEKNIILPVKLQDSEDKKMEGSQERNCHVGNHLNENENPVVPYTFSDLQNLRVRIQAIEQAAVEIYQPRAQEIVDLHAKLEGATRQVEELKSECRLYRRNLKSSTEISEADRTLLTKDILLDQISKSSSYGISRREQIEPDNQVISPSSDRNHDLQCVKSVRKQKGEPLDSDGLIEKEFGVDKLEISKRFTDPLQEGNKGKVLERLNSDVQKLANLQITVEDLKRKLEVTEKGKRGKAVIECETLKGQLEEADMAIMKLFDLNGKLIKSIEDNSIPDVKTSFDSEDGVKRRIIPEQARRMSEKIGRLQLEVQKLQFVLLKLDEKDNKGKNQTSETKRRILLRDYLYGMGRTRSGRKKSHFCACVQPSATED